MGQFFRDELEKEFSAIGIKKKKPKVLTTIDRQVVTSNAFRDRSRSAMPSGKRISKSGNIYYEYRKNRTDKIGGTL